MGLYYIASEENQAYLAHHGVKGQKWGIRRYQNPDGTLSAKGLKRYGHMQNQEGKSSTTRKVMKDWWDLDDDAFKSKYKVDKETYSKRVRKYGDPYKNSPLVMWAHKQNARKNKIKKAGLTVAQGANYATGTMLKGMSKASNTLVGDTKATQALSSTSRDLYDTAKLLNKKKRSI